MIIKKELKIKLTGIAMFVMAVLLAGCGVVQPATFFPQESKKDGDENGMLETSSTEVPSEKTPVPTIVVEENTGFIGEWYMDGIYDKDENIYRDGALEKFTIYEDQRIVFENGVDKLEGSWYSNNQDTINIAMPGGAAESGKLTKDGSRLMFKADDTHNTYYSHHPHGAATIFYSNGGTVVSAEKSDYLGKWVLSIFTENGKTQTAYGIKEIGNVLMSYVDITDKYMDIASVYKIDRFVPYEMKDGHISFEITKRSYFMDVFGRSRENAEFLPLDLIYKKDVSGTPYLELTVSNNLVLYYSKANTKYDDYVVPSSDLTSSMPYLKRNTKVFSLSFSDFSDINSQVVLNIQAPANDSKEKKFYEVYEDGVLNHYAFVLGDIKEDAVSGFNNIPGDASAIHFYLKDMRKNPNLRSIASSPNLVETINGFKFYGAAEESENGRKNVIWCCPFNQNYAITIESDTIPYNEGSLLYDVINNMNIVLMVSEGKSMSSFAGGSKSITPPHKGARLENRASE